MTALIDLDSILYKAVYKIVSFSQIKKALTLMSKEEARQWFMEEVYNEGINRCENEILKMQKYLEEIFPPEISEVKLYITTCKKNFRNEVDPEYKGNRKSNKYVWLLREHYKQNGAAFSDTLEADDLISIDANKIGVGNCIVVSMDKDLKQIGGYYWSFYSHKSKDINGDFILNEYGFHETEYKQKTVTFISKNEAELFFWEQMLIGDTSDNIKGIKGIGKVRARKELEHCETKAERVLEIYLEKSTEDHFLKNHQLLKLKQ